MNKPIFIGIAITALLVVGYFIFSNSNKNPNNVPQKEIVQERSNHFSPVPDVVNKQASFAIFTKGTFRVFTATMYHNLSEDVYIQQDNPNIILIKKSGVTWNDFFKTLPFSLTKNCLTTGTKETFCTNQNDALKFYLNGVKDDDLLETEIQDGDKALITYGSENEEQIKKQMDKLNSFTEVQQ